MSIGRLAIWTRTMLSWFWFSQEFVLLGTASSLGISDTRVTESNCVHFLNSMDTAIWHHLFSGFLHFLAFSDPLLSLVYTHRSGLLLSCPIVSVAFAFFSKSVRWWICQVKERSLNVCQTSMCVGVCAVAGGGCLACYSNTAEWGRCRVTQFRPASFHGHRKRAGWVWSVEGSVTGVWKWSRFFCDFNHSCLLHKYLCLKKEGATKYLHVAIFWFGVKHTFYAT